MLLVPAGVHTYIFPTEEGHSLFNVSLHASGYNHSMDLGTGIHLSCDRSTCTLSMCSLSKSTTCILLYLVYTCVLSAHVWFKLILFRRKGFGAAYNTTMPSPGLYYQAIFLYYLDCLCSTAHLNSPDLGNLYNKTKNKYQQVPPKLYKKSP